MTDNAAPGGQDLPETPANPAAYAAAEPSSGGPMITPPVAKSGRWKAVIIPVALVAILGIVLFAVRNNVKAGDLKVGDCFNIPNGTTVKTVETQPCTQSHTGEVIFVGQYTDGSTYPISLSLDRFIESSCTPAFETYVGRAIDSDPALSIGYFHPTRDSWDAGDRTITCYVSQPDESPMTKSLKG